VRCSNITWVVARLRCYRSLWWTANKESGRHISPTPMIGIALRRWKREMICSKILKDELPINSTSGELLTRVLPTLDLCGYGYVCVGWMDFSVSFFFCLSSSYIPRPWVLRHGRGDIVIVRWDMAVLHCLGHPVSPYQRAIGGRGTVYDLMVSLRDPGSGHIGLQLGMW
jgi:hypothetical protein